jgi:hypothetical protein
MTHCVHHHDNSPVGQCRICGNQCCDECIHTPTRICHGCLMKIGVLILVVMVIISYMAWFGVF